jgi:hypothetical protein
LAGWGERASRCGLGGMELWSVFFFLLRWAWAGSFSFGPSEGCWFLGRGMGRPMAVRRGPFFTLEASLV